MHTQTISEVFEAQGKNRWNCALSSARARKSKLEDLRTVIESKREAICSALAADLRRHPTETEIFEITSSVAEIDHSLAHLDQWMEPQARPTPLALVPASSHIRYEAQGRVLVLGAWNYPFYLSIVPVVAAISAGNTVILKPSELSPATSRVLKEIFDSAFEVQDVAVIEGGVEVSQELLKLPFDHFFYTGGGTVGKIVMKAAAEHLAKVTLELGGKSPVIVDESANAVSAGKRIAWGKLVNSGQTCIAPDYVLVHRSKEAELLSGIRSQIEASYGADEGLRQSSPDLARIVNTRHFARIRELVQQSVAQGAKLELGGKFEESEKYIAPTVLTGVKAEHAVMADEIFGPVLPVISVDSLDEAIAFVRARPKPLALYVFSKRGDRTEKVLRETTSGGVTVNDCMLHIANPHLPFGGVGPSGIGSYHGFPGFQCFSHEKAVLTQAPVNAVGWLSPPYTERVRNLVSVMKRFL
jgi:aldehyde dehydrogenase (NAD+)